MRQYIAVLAIISALSSADAVASESPGPLFVVKASLNTAGPYGESWYLTLTEDEVALQVFYSDRPSGSLVGRFTVSDEVVAGLKATIRAQRFFELGDLSPNPMALHRPDFELDVSFP